MGEVAEDMCDGTACQLCGQYFQDPKDEDQLYVHGYPVTCKECYNQLSAKDKKHHQKALVDTI